jgi:hypothetical protein
MARRNREIQTFNVAMLDVISSAMGAFLLLYLLVAENREQLSESLATANAEMTAHRVEAQASRVAAEQEAQQAAVARQSQSAAEQNAARQQQARAQTAAELAAAQAELQRAQAELEAAQAQLERMAEVLTGGEAIAECTVRQASVQIEFWDHGQLDGDRVNIRFNTELVGNNVTLPAPESRWSRTMQLEPGINYVVIEALNTGTIGENSARLLISPCQGTRPEQRDWLLFTNERRHVSIRRE